MGAIGYNSLQVFKLFAHKGMPDATERAVIESVTLRTRDLERSTSFYQDVLGLIGRDDGDGIRSFAAQNSERALVHLVESPNALPRPARALGLYHFALLVPDRRSLAAVLRRLAEAGVPLQGASDHHVSEALYLADPDGHGIEIYRDRPREDWTYTPRGELFMTTARLDLEGLRTESAEASGLPPGTIVGHIHLHVSDLKKAGGFYENDLGFDATVRSFPGALFLSRNGYHHHVGLNTWAGPQAAPPNDATIGMIDFAVRGANGSDGHSDGRSDAASDKTVTVTDPDGIRIRFLA